MAQNPMDIVTIIIEDYVRAPKGLTKLFTHAGLTKYWYPVTAIPINGKDWPSVTDMVARNHRLLVFSNVASKEADEGIAYQWRYMVENERKLNLRELRLQIRPAIYHYSVIIMLCYKKISHS